MWIATLTPVGSSLPVRFLWLPVASVVPWRIPYKAAFVVTVWVRDPGWVPLAPT